MKKIAGHLHFEGSVPTQILARIAAKNGLPTHSEVFRRYRPRRFNSFADFSRLIIMAAQSLRTVEDFVSSCRLLGERLHQEGVIYAEVIWVPQLYSRHPIDLDAILRALNAARDQILDKHGVEIRWIVDLVRGYPDQGLRVVKWLKSIAPRSQNIVAVGLGGNETYPLSDMIEPLVSARDLGLGIYPHSGEQCGPMAIDEVIEHLAPVRIAHGIRAVEDDGLLRKIKAKGIHLDICPTSNVALGVYRDMTALPIRKLIEADCAFSINTDDPAFFGTNMVVELRACMKLHGLTDSFVQQMYQGAVQATFLDERQKQHLRDRMA